MHSARFSMKKDGRRESFFKSISFRFSIILVVILIVCSVALIAKTVTAEKKVEKEKLVVSIQIKQGDSLWSIASAYITDEYSSINEYIEEIKTSNGLIDDTIHYGNYIIVPYFADSGHGL